MSDPGAFSMSRYKEEQMFCRKQEPKEPEFTWTPPKSTTEPTPGRAVPKSHARLTGGMHPDNNKPRE
jgi:hypothetical protein